MSPLKRLHSDHESKSFTDRTIPGEKSQRLKHAIWSELSIDILILIYDKLTYKDSVSFTCVCKNWHNIINRSVPWLLLYNSEKEKPWFLVRHGSRTTGYYHDQLSTPVNVRPSLASVYEKLGKEDFAGISVLASKRGWLLLTDHKRSEFCCYNVFTSDVMRLPGLWNSNESVPMKATFSDVPNSQDSVIFLICQNTQNSVEIKTCHPGTYTWRSIVFPAHSGNLPPCQDVVYNKGKFYCIFRGGLGIYDIDNQEFHYFELAMPRLKSPKTTFHLAESDGEILMMLADGEIPYFPMWKIDLQNKGFSPVENLGAKSFFLSFGTTSVCARAETKSFMDKVFYTGFTNSCWFMCMKDKTHAFSQSYPWITWERTGSNFIWIEPSK